MAKKFAFGVLVFSIVVALQAQDSTKPKAFDYAKFKPIAHFFTNAEYNPSIGVDKDYSFWIGRMMFGFQYQFNNKWSTKVLIDRTRLTGSMNTMYVKVANLRYAPNDRFAIEAGAINQNNYIPFEGFWGYRFIAETYQDRYFVMPSTDIGVCGYYRISKMLSLDAGVSNGEGPRIDQDSYGKIKFAGGLNFNPTDHVVTRVFYHHKSSGEPGFSAGENLFNVYAGYHLDDKFRIGAEFILVDGYGCMPGVKSYGGTAFGVLTLYKTLKFLARFDRINMIGTALPTGTIPVSGRAMITGFTVNPLKSITLSLNYQGFYPDLTITNPTHRVLFGVEYRI